MTRRSAELGTILVVEDDPSISELPQLYLSARGLSRHLFGRGRPCTRHGTGGAPHPRGARFDVAGRFRAAGAQEPACILHGAGHRLTAKDADQDKILGLELGADDYMTKPFSPGELVARARAVLRRAAPADESTSQVLGAIELIPDERVVRVDGKAVDLTPREFELLHYLLVNRGIALSRERLLEEVWGYTFYGDARTVDVHVRQVRKKLGRWAPAVQTVWGLGYKADPDASPSAEDAEDEQQ